MAPPSVSPGRLPWFGEGQTTVRGGYQLSYVLGGGRFNTLNGPLANPPGSSYTGHLQRSDRAGIPRHDKFGPIVPVPVTVKPMQPIPVDYRSVGLTAFDSNYLTPYIQNLTMAVTRNMGRKLTLDMRYVGNIEPQALRNHGR